MVTNKFNNKKILITSGPTWVPIDGVRVISNHSSGQMGQTIAQELSKRKAKVTLIEGPVRYPLKSKTINVIKFKFYDELVKAIRGELRKKYDIIIHAAAVSDYKVKEVTKKKLRSDIKELPLTLIPTKKIIYSIRQQSPKSKLVGFKLEYKVSPTIARQRSLDLFENAKCDLVVVNRAHKNQYKAYIVDRLGDILAEENSKLGLAIQLINKLGKQL